jgi:hypothetical protein
MRARDAENLIADVLTKGSIDTDSENQISESVLLGLRRSRPIYARKIKEKESIKQRRQVLFYRRVLLGLTYPIRAFIRLIKS